MTREEAIKIVKDLYDKSLFLKKDKEAVRTLIPEVEESEDERIRKEMIALFKGQIHSTSAEDNKKYVAWLEKQDKNKDLPPVTDRETLDEYAYQVAYDLSNDWLKDTPTWDDVETAVKLGAKWLEKQCEQSNANKGYWRGYREGKQEVLDKYSELEKQGEQNPAGCPEYCVMSNCANCPYHPVLIKKPTWSEEDERMINTIISDLERHGGKEDSCYLAEINWLKFLKYRVQLKQEWSEEDDAMIDNVLGTYKTLEDMLDLTTSQDKDILESMNFERDWIKSLKYRIQPKQEWSEEDKNILKAIHNSIDVECLSKNGVEYLDMIYWFRSLKDRVQLQPKQEWSEVDELKIGDIHDAITLDDELEESYKEKLHNFLKFLCSQNTWKPSNEQMEALKVSIYDTIPSKEVMSKVESLYYDLKKLKENIIYSKLNRL